MPDLGQLSEELMDFIHPRLKSDIDSVDIITSIHASLEGVSMYWMNVSHKAAMRACRTLEINAQMAEGALRVLGSDRCTS